ncbi:hypothetical protein D3C87_76590 [compost metagenome]
MFDINCRDNICPICGSTMRDNSIISIINKTCKNECYRVTNYIFPNDMYCVIIFNRSYHSFGKSDRERTNSFIEKKIKYWKENERYILKILELEL